MQTNIIIRSWVSPNHSLLFIIFNLFMQASMIFLSLAVDSIIWQIITVLLFLFTSVLAFNFKNIQRFSSEQEAIDYLQREAHHEHYTQS